MGKNSTRSHTQMPQSELDEFKTAHTPKLLQVLLLVMGITLGIAITAFLKNAIYRSNGPSINDQDIVEGDLPNVVPRTKIRTEKQRIQAPRQVQAPNILPSVPMASLPSAPKVAPVIAPRAFESSAPLPASKIAPEPKVALKAVAVAGLLYDRDSFQNCSEDCNLILRTASGQSVKVILRKSRFQNSMDRENSRIDIEGYVNSDRVVRVESIRSYPKLEIQAPEPVVLQLPPVKEVEFKKLPSEEFVNIDEIPDRVVEQKAKPKRSRSQSLKSRLEDSTRNSSKPAPVDGEGDSFQDRLRRSTR